MSKEQNEERVEEQTAAPSLDVIEAALKKEEYKNNYNRVLRSTVFSLIVVAAAAVLVAVLVLPVPELVSLLRVFLQQLLLCFCFSTAHRYQVTESIQSGNDHRVLLFRSYC